MKEYCTLITELGKAKIAKALYEGQKLNLTKFAAGDGGGIYYKPQAEQTKLRNEKWRGPINSCKVDENSPNMIEIIGILPPNEGGFTIREVGVFDDEGDLIIIANTPDTQKVLITSGAAGEIKITLYVEISNAEVIQMMVDPNTITATKKDLYKHDHSPLAHNGRFAEKSEFDNHITNADIHITPTMKKVWDGSIGELTKHTEDQDRHVTKEQKESWTKAAGKQAEAIKRIQENSVNIADLQGRITRIEDAMFNDITGNPFSISFKDLEGISLIRGNYNTEKNRIEC